MRVGHARPIGTVTAPRRFEWRSDDEPELGDVALQTAYEGGDPDELERAFLVVGIEETASKRWRYRIVFERVAYGTLPDEGRRFWHFHNVPR